jgi:hypothetical protein
MRHQNLDLTVNRQKRKCISQLHLIDFSECNQITNDGAMELECIQSLEHVYLANCVQFQLEPMYALSWCLQSLDIGGLRLSDSWGEYASSWIGHCSNLRHINLKHCVWVDDDVLRDIGELALLEFLDIGHCTLISYAGVEHLLRLDKLRVLNASDTVVGCNLAGLAALPALRCLEVHFLSSPSSQGLINWAPLRHLTHLDAFQMTPFLDKDYEWIGSFEQLRSLSLRSYYAVNQAAVGHICKLKHLERLTLRWPDRLPEEALTLLSQLEGLQHLSLLDLRETLTEVGISCISGMPQLTSLALGGVARWSTPMTNKIGEMHRLRSLALRHCLQLQDTHVRALAWALRRSLRTLCLTDCYQLSSLSFDSICSHLHELDELELHYDVNPEGSAVALQRLPHLKTYIRFTDYEDD